MARTRAQQSAGAATFRPSQRPKKKKKQELYLTSQHGKDATMFTVCNQTAKLSESLSRVYGSASCVAFRERQNLR